MGEHADHFLQTGQQIAGSLEVDVGGNEFRVEADDPVRCGVQHLAQLQLHVGLVALLLAQQQAEIWQAGADLARAAVAGIGVGDVQFLGGIARQHVLLLGPAGFDVVAGDQRQREIDRSAAGIRRDVQSQRLTLAAQLEQGPVREDAAGLAEHQLAHVEELAVDLQIEESPGIAAQLLGARLELVIVVSIALLEVLRAQQHAFLPDNLVQAHAYFPSSASGSNSAMPRSSRLRAMRVRSCGGTAMT